MTLLKCNSCGRYTLKKTCPACGRETANPSPARYSPQDKYGKYRRQIKELNQQ